MHGKHRTHRVAAERLSRLRALGDRISSRAQDHPTGSRERAESPRRADASRLGAWVCSRINGRVVSRWPPDAAGGPGGV